MGTNVERVIDLDNGDTLGYYSEGHVDKAEFSAELDREEDVEAPVDEIKHGYMRQYPLGEDDCDEYAANRLEFRKTPRDGWSPVTYWGDV